MTAYTAKTMKIIVFRENKIGAKWQVNICCFESLQWQTYLQHWSLFCLFYDLNICHNGIEGKYTQPNQKELNRQSISLKPREAKDFVNRYELVLNDK